METNCPMVWIFFLCLKKKILRGLGGTILQQLNLRIYHQLSFAFWILLTMNAWRAGVMFSYSQYSPCTWLMGWHRLGAQLMWAAYTLLAMVRTSENLIEISSLDNWGWSRLWPLGQTECGTECFSTYNVHMNHKRSILNVDFDSLGFVWGLGLCISNNLTGLQIALWTVKV